MIYLITIDSNNRKYTAEPYQGTEVLPDETDAVGLNVVEPGVTCLIASQNYLDNCQKTVSMSWHGKYEVMEVPLEYINIDS